MKELAIRFREAERVLLEGATTVAPLEDWEFILGGLTPEQRADIEKCSDEDIQKLLVGFESEISSEIGRLYALAEDIRYGDEVEALVEICGHNHPMHSLEIWQKTLRRMQITEIEWVFLCNLIDEDEDLRDPMIRGSEYGEIELDPQYPDLLKFAEGRDVDVSALYKRINQAYLEVHKEQD